MYLDAIVFALRLLKAFIIILILALEIFYLLHVRPLHWAAKFSYDLGLKRSKKDQF